MSADDENVLGQRLGLRQSVQSGLKYLARSGGYLIGAGLVGLDLRQPMDLASIITRHDAQSCVVTIRARNPAEMAIGQHFFRV